MIEMPSLFDLSGGSLVDLMYKVVFILSDSKLTLYEEPFIKEHFGKVIIKGSYIAAWCPNRVDRNWG